MFAVGDRVTFSHPYGYEGFGRTGTIHRLHGDGVRLYVVWDVPQKKMKNYLPRNLSLIESPADFIEDLI